MEELAFLLSNFILEETNSKNKRLKRGEKGSQ